MLLLSATRLVVAWTPAPVIPTSYGPVVGSLESNGVARYLGVPFAAPPVGSRRFAAPFPPAPWTSVLNASTLPPICPQFNGNGDVAPLPESEDCLLLRITVPPRSDGEKFPVLAYVHGGTNVAGGFSAPESTADWSRATATIIIEIPYRLGVLGFAAFDGSVATWDSNAGIRDAALGLQWVRANAAAFGGDIERVTLGGESSGAVDILALLVSPGSAGTFSSVMWHSGGAISWKPSLAIATTATFAADAHLNCTGPPEVVLECMRAAPVSVLQNASYSSAAEPNTVMIDRDVLPASVLRLIREGRFPRNVTFLVLLNSYEGDSFIPCSAPPACEMSELAYNMTMQAIAQTDFGANETFISLLHTAYDAHVPTHGYFGALSKLVSDFMSCSGRALAFAGEQFGRQSFRVNQSQVSALV